jgi:hypothetical protein
VVPAHLNDKESTMKTPRIKQLLVIGLSTAAAVGVRSATDIERVLRSRGRIAVGAMTLLLLVGMGVVDGGSSAASVATKQTTTTIRFTVSEKGHDKLPGGQVLVTRASGSGTLTLADTPQAKAVNQSTSATGTIRFHGWRVVGNRVIDDANLSMDVVSGTYRFTNRIQNVNLKTTVTESDPSQKFKCPVGSAGGATLLDGKVKSQPDSFATGDFCGLHILDFGGTVGAPASVKVTVKRGTS